MVIRTLVRRSAYHDSVTLMQVQKALAALPGVEDAGLVMGTEANKELLRQAGLYAAEADAAGPDDLIVAVRSSQAEAADAALGQLDALFQQRKQRTAAAGGDYRPRTLAAALKQAPQSNLAVISVPGRFAFGVAKEALAAGLHVLLFSDNVPLADEVALKEEALRRNLLLMGPDCGTALLNGVALGFANVVRRGHVGVVGASGTGIQQFTCLIEAAGAGISQAIGTGGRDLSTAVAGRTMLQAFDALVADPATTVIALLSKPPAPEVAQQVLAHARRSPKPVVVNFLGQAARPAQGPLHFAETLAQAASLAASLEASLAQAKATPAATDGPAPGRRFLRGLFSGGTLAYEALYVLSRELGPVWSNTPLDKAYALTDPLTSRGHTVLDLGDDVFTVGRLHPMMDPTYLLRRLAQEAADPEVAVLLLDVVLGYGAHPDPAQLLAPAIADARAAHGVEVIVSLCGAAADPQDPARQREVLEQAGARVFAVNAEAAAAAAAAVRAAEGRALAERGRALASFFGSDLHCINLGVELFAESLVQQGVPVVAVDWQPPAGGNARMASLLERLKG